MPEYTTHYVFDLEINGAKAVEQAKALRAQLDKILGETALAGAGGRAGGGAGATGKALGTAAGYQKSVEDAYRRITEGANRATDATKKFDAVTQGALDVLSRMKQGVGVQALYEDIAAHAEKSGAATAQATQQEAAAVQTAMDQMAQAAQQTAAQVTTAQGQMAQAAQQVTQAMLPGMAGIGAGAMTGLGQRPGQVTQLAMAGFGAPNIRSQIALAQAQMQQAFLGGGGLTQQQTLLQAFTEGVNEATVNIWGLRRAAYGLESFGRSLSRFSLQQIQNIRQAVDAYGDFSAGITRAGMAMEMPTELMGALGDAVLETSKDLAMFRPEDISEGLRLWAAGMGTVVQNEDDLNRVLKETISIQKLAAMNNVSLAQTTDTVGGILHEYGLTVKDVGMVTDVLNYVARNTFANVDDIGSAFRMVGPLASSMGVSFTETASAMALLSNANLKGTMVGRALRQMFLQMLKPSADYNKTMNEVLGITGAVGEEWRKMVFPNGQFIGLANYVELLADSMARLTDEERNSRLAALSTANELPTLVQLVNMQIQAMDYGANVIRGYQKAMMGLNDAEAQMFRTMYEQLTGLPFSMEGATALMTNMWQQFVESPAYALQQMQRRWDAAVIELGQSLQRTLLPLLEEFVSILEGVGDYMKRNPWMADLVRETMRYVLLLGTVFSLLGFIVKTATNIHVLAKGIGKVLAWAGIGKAAAGAGTAAGGGAAAAGGAEAGAVGAGLAAKLFPPTMAALGVYLTGRQVAKETTALKNYVLEIVDAYQTYEEFQQEALKVVEAHDWFYRMLPRGAWLLKVLRDQGIIPTKEAWEELRATVQAGKEAAPSGDVSMWKLQQAEGMGDAYAREMAKMQEALSAEPELTGMEKLLAEFEKSNAELQDLLAERNRIAEQYSKRYTDIMERAAEQAADAERNFQDRLRDMEDDYRRSRLQAIEDYGRNEARSIEDHQRDMARAEEDFNREEARRTDDHLKELERLEREHQNRLIDLLEARDVQGIVKEMRDYKLRRDEMAGSTEDVAQRRADFERQQAQKEEDFQLQLARRREDFRLELQRRQEDYDRQVQEAHEDYERQVAERKAALQQELNDLVAERNKALAEVGKATTALEVAGAMDPMYYLDALEGKLGGVTRAADELIAKENEIIAKWVEANKPETKQITVEINYAEQARALGLVNTAPTLEPVEAPRGAQREEDWFQRLYGRQAGGYVTRGNYALGEQGREFVLNARTTRTLEEQWGHLSQPLIAGLGRGGGLSVVIQQANSYTGMGAEDQEWYRRVAYEEAERAIQEAVRSYKR